MFSPARKQYLSLGEVLPGPMISRSAFSPSFYERRISLERKSTIARNADFVRALLDKLLQIRKPPLVICYVEFRIFELVCESL